MEPPTIIDDNSYEIQGTVVVWGKRPNLPSIQLYGQGGSSGSDTSGNQEPPPPAPTWCNGPPESEEELKEAIAHEALKIAIEIFDRPDHGKARIWIGHIRGVGWSAVTHPPRGAPY